MLIAIVGVPLGVVSAIHKDKPIDQVARTISVMGISMPVFWFGLALILLFYSQLHCGARAGSRPTSRTPCGSPAFLIDSLLAGDLRAFGSALYHMILPAAVLAFANLGILTRRDPRRDARRDAGGLRPHREGERPVAPRHHHAPCAQERADPVGDPDRPRLRRPALRCRPDRDDLRLARHGDLCRLLGPDARLPGDHGLHHRRLDRLRCSSASSSTSPTWSSTRRSGRSADERCRRCGGAAEGFGARPALVPGAAQP